MSSNPIIIAVRKMLFTKRIRAEVWQLLADLTGADMDIAQALNTTATVFRQRRQNQVANILLDIRAAIPRNDMPSVVHKYAPGGESLLFTFFGDTDAHGLFRGAARIARVELIIQRAILSAVAMPILISMILCGVLILAGSQLFPTFLQISPLEQWPGISRSFGGFTMWFAKSGYVLGFILLLIIAALSWAVPNWIGVGRKFGDKVPPFSFYKLKIGASFLFAVVEGGRMGQAINSEFLYKMAARGSRYTRDRVRNIARMVTQTSMGAATLAAGQDFPSQELNTILNAFSSQENWLEKLAGFTDRWLEDVEARAKRTAAILNVVLLALTAGIITLLLASIFAISQTLAF